MADSRSHRGAHPEDEVLFGVEFVPALRSAVGDLSWLLSRGYGPDSSLKLVGDRHGLRGRQRIAVRRATCSDHAGRQREVRRVDAFALRGATVRIDGYNLLTTIEAALAGGVVLACRDGCYRDMASMHGTYRRVEETEPALRWIRKCLDDWQVAACHWYLDRPVSNSGRLKQLLLEAGASAAATWDVDLVPDPDRVLIEGAGIVVSADSQVLDGCGPWFNMAAEMVREMDDVWLIELDESSQSGTTEDYGRP